ncbi:MAG: hypothetical protein BZ137_00310 [Methanosphaera sp. rholeuAM130]|nr:MAG: hypothetical protein BZ137_00310 [Methanosphaera sp. rholeuAM130]
MNAINSTFRQNNADCAGAIINLQRATINGCEFNNNYAEGHGIVILNIANYNNQKNQPQLALSNSLITNNNYIEDSMIANSYLATITDCLITNNSCGEGMIFNNATLKITGTKTYNNEVLGWGGIIQNEGNLTATNNLFMNTTGAFNGGVICIYHGDTSIISTNVFDSNEANEFDGMGGCISVKDSKNTTIRLNTFKNNRAFEGGAIYSDTTSIDICYNKFINNRAEYVGSAISNYGDNFKIRYNNFTANVVSNDGTNLNNYGSKVTVTGNVNYNGKKYPSTVENVGDKGQIIYNRFEDTIKAVTTTTTVSALSGVVGDRITLTATVKDNTGTAVEGGRVIFKLNGVTLKDNGKLSGSSNPLKVYVSNGIATTTIIADLSMKSISQISASYIGTTLYEKSNSNTAKAQIKLRSARIVVTSNVKTIKQGQTLTITATVYDTTNGKDSTNLVKYSDEFVYFKVNGITLKDSKGNMLKAKIVNGVATVNYTVPLGLSGVTDGKTMTPKNHTILAGFYNKNYNEDIRNTSYFQVERSNITIAIANATVNNKTHTLSLTATIRDYLGNIVAGPNKCVIKINGVSLKNGTEAMYYYSTNGVLKINNIKIPAYNKYTSIEIVTQDRLAYKNQRNTTSTIRVVN